MQCQIWTDGGSRGNPGTAGAGVFIADANGKEVFAGGYYLGRMTNNAAEYEGLIRGLQQALAMGATEAKVLCDSELVVKQMNGQYRVKNANLKPLYQQARDLLAEFHNASIAHTYREGNKEADALANQAMDARADIGDACTPNAAKLTAADAVDDEVEAFADPADVSTPSVLAYHLDLRETLPKTISQAELIAVGKSHHLMHYLAVVPAGQQFELQQTWPEVTFTVMQGRGQLQLAQQSHSLKPGSWIQAGPFQKGAFQAEPGGNLVVIVAALTG